MYKNIFFTFLDPHDDTKSFNLFQKKFVTNFVQNMFVSYEKIKNITDIVKGGKLSKEQSTLEHGPHQ